MFKIALFGKYSFSVLRSLIQYFCIISMSMTVMLIIVQSSKIISIIIEKGVSLLFFLKLIFFLTPFFLHIIMPIALTISAIIVFYQMYIRRELLVLRASGANDTKIMYPLFLFAVLFFVLHCAISFYIMPKSYKRFKDTESFVKSRFASLLFQEGVFNTQIKGVTVYIDRKISSNEFGGIFVHNSINPNKSIVITAKYGQLLSGPSGPIFRLQDGSQQHENKVGGKMHFLLFDSYDLDLSTFYDFDSGRMQDSREMYITQAFKSQSNKAIANAHYRVIWPMYSLILPILSALVILAARYTRFQKWRMCAISGCFAIASIIFLLLAKSKAAGDANLVFTMYLTVLFLMLCIVGAAKNIIPIRKIL